MKKVYCLLGLALMLLVACSSGGGTQDTGGGYLTGVWSGTWASSRQAGLGGAVELQLIQNDTDLSGSAQAQGPQGALYSVVFIGKTDRAVGQGRILFGLAMTDQGQATLSGEFGPSQITGTYSWQGGADQGSFLLTRQ